MWKYEKKLQFPVNIKKKNVEMAKYIITQNGGYAGELGATLRYLNQRYTMPDDKGKAILSDIATEEMAHLEIISTMVYQLLDGATPDEQKGGVTFGGCGFWGSEKKRSWEAGERKEKMLFTHKTLMEFHLPPHILL